MINALTDFERFGPYLVCFENFRKGLKMELELLHIAEQKTSKHVDNSMRDQNTTNTSKKK